MGLRIFVDELLEGELVIKGDEHHYLSRVHRSKAGDRIVLCDGKGRVADGTLTTVDKKESRCEVGPSRELPLSPFQLSCAPALIKGERMGVALSKLVELGCHRILPMVSERCVVRPDPARVQSRHKRFEAIVDAAVRQSRNPRRPQLEPIQSFDQILELVAGSDLVLMPYTGAGSRPLAECLEGSVPSSCALLIGPEGGFTDEEAARARHAGAELVSLGPRILRAETASIAVAAILGYRFGDVGSR